MSQLCLQRLNAANSDVTVLLGPFLSSPSNCQDGRPGCNLKVQVSCMLLQAAKQV